MATLTIDVTAAQAIRIQNAFGRYLNTTDENGTVRPATGAEIEAYIKSEVKRIVLNMERLAAEQAIAVPEF